MKAKYLSHKMGGRIPIVHGVGHHTHDGVPYWFYVCDVKWDDGTASDKTEVMPDRVICDGSNPKAAAEINKVSEALMDYLRDNGKWLKKGKWVDDRLINWIPKVRDGVQSIA